MATKSKTTDISTGRISRRGFLRGAAAIGAFSIISGTALGLDGATPPSDRIRMGFIGVGGQGGGHLLGGAWTHVPGGYAGRKEVQIMGICDIRKSTREDRLNAVNTIYAERFGQANYNGCQGYVDFREMIARDDIDAVLIACPIHWHAIMTICAVEAGKDVYCEKPIAVSVEQSRAMAEAVKRNGRIYQAGTQQRSEYSDKFRVACQHIRAGAIGDIKEVYAYNVGGAYGWPGNPIGAPQPEPTDFDWNLFLGPAQWFPYDGNTGTFRFGGVGDINWAPHHYDFVHWVLGMDRTGPVEIWLDNGHPVYKYANGIIVHGAPYPGEPVGAVGGACFVGTKGRIAVDRENIVSYPANILKNPPPPQDINIYLNTGHANNFLECVRTRQATICDPETAHRSRTFVLLGGIALTLQRPLKWNPELERFENDDEANRMLSLATRSPWHV